MTGMKKSRFTEEQISGFIRQAEAGMPIKDLCRKGDFSDATFYKWRAKYGSRVEVQTLGRFVGPLAPIPAVFSLDGGLQCIQIALSQGIALNPSDDVRHPGVDAVKDGRLLCQRRLLCHVTQSQAASALEDVVIPLFLLVQSPEQGGLASAIAANQADTFSGKKRKIGAVQKRNVAESKVGGSQGDREHREKEGRCLRKLLKVCYSSGLR